jgi:hypothetical protein
MTVHEHNGSSFADPYVDPVEGTIYKLPDKPGMYRMAQLQSSTQETKQAEFYINAQVESLGVVQSEIQECFSLYTEVLPVPTEHYFFTRLYIGTIGGQHLSIDLENRRIQASMGTTGTTFYQPVKYGTSVGPFTISTLYRGEKISLPRTATTSISTEVVSFDIRLTLPTGIAITVVVMYSKNPQVRNGFRIRYDQNIDGIDGPLIHRYRTKFWTIGKLTDSHLLTKHANSTRPCTRSMFRDESLITVMSMK